MLIVAKMQFAAIRCCQRAGRGNLCTLLAPLRVVSLSEPEGG